MRSIVTFEGIDEALENLNYNKRTLKYKLINTIREQYRVRGEVASVIEIDTDFLVRELWDTGDDPSIIRNRKKNFNSIRSTVNADLRRLYEEDKNSEGIIINTKNIFDMSDEAKSEMLEAFSYGDGGDSQMPLGKIADVLNVINDFISNKETSLEDDEKFEQLKEIIKEISGKVGITIDTSVHTPGGQMSSVIGEGKTEIFSEGKVNSNGMKVSHGTGGEYEQAKQDKVKGNLKGSGVEKSENADIDEIAEDAIVEEPAEDPEDADYEEVEGEAAGYNEFEEIAEEAGDEEVEEEVIDEIEELPEDELEEIQEDEIEEESVDELEDDEFEKLEVYYASVDEPGDIPGGSDGEETGVEAGIAEIEEVPEDWIEESADEREEDEYEEVEVDDVEGDEFEGIPEEELDEELEDEVIDEIEESPEEEFDEITEDEVDEEVEDGITEEPADESEDNEYVEVEVDNLADEELEDDVIAEIDEIPEEGLEEIQEDEIEEEPVNEQEEDEFDELEVEGASGGEQGEIPVGGSDKASGDEGGTAEAEAIPEDEIEEVPEDEFDEIAEDEVEDETADELEDEVIAEIDEIPEEELEEIQKDEIEDEPVDELEDDEYDELKGKDASGGCQGAIPVGDSDGEPGNGRGIAEIGGIPGDELDEIPADEVEEELADDLEEDDDDYEEVEIFGAADDKDGGFQEEEYAPHDEYDYTLDEILDDYDASGYTSEEGQQRALLLADKFDKMLSETERYYNRYLLIPGGKYIAGHISPNSNEKKQRDILLPDFYFGKFPVTNHLFELFVEKTGYVTTAERTGYGIVYKGRYRNTIDEKNGRKTLEWSSSLESAKIEGACWFMPNGPGSSIHGKRNYPVVQVSLEDAMAFAAWTGKRLPTEDEWEAASRTSKGLDFPWGGIFKEGLCNIEVSAIGDTTPVDEFEEAANYFGVYDLLGNVLEWTSTNKSVSDNRSYIAKGGSWVSGEKIRLTQRFMLEAGTSSNILGFRCIAYK